MDKERDSLYVDGRAARARWKKGNEKCQKQRKKATTQLHAVVSRECLINILQFPLRLTAVRELSWGPEIETEDQLNETISSIHPALNVDVVPQPSSESEEWKFQFNVCFFRRENIFSHPSFKLSGASRHMKNVCSRVFHIAPRAECKLCVSVEHNSAVGNENSSWRSFVSSSSSRHKRYRCDIIKC